MSTSIIISAIVATAQNGVIGHNNQLPWHLPADLQHFKNLTTHHPILMGRKTHESIGKPLPNRLNIVLTRDQDYEAPGCVVVHSIAAAIEQAQAAHCQEIFIIGGSEIYKQLLPHIQRIYLTVIHHAFVGDAFFPELLASEWQTLSEEHHQADAKNNYAYSFLVLERVSKAN